jgi:phytoene synthase
VRISPNPESREEDANLRGLLVANTISGKADELVMSESLAYCYSICHALARNSGSSFYYALWLLPRAKRRGMYALYAFSRFSDDLADHGPLELRQRNLSDWAARLEDALHGQTSGPILTALLDTANRFNIPHEYLRAIVRGVQMDLQPQQPETMEELENYCYHVAGAVGLACLHIWGFTSDKATDLARTCGTAFQLTNILRDCFDDASAGRCYLPQEDCRRFGVSVDDLDSRPVKPALAELFRFEVDRTEHLFAAAWPLWQYLNIDGRRAYGAMFQTYRELLRLVAATRTSGSVAPVSVRRRQKLLFAARSYCLPSARVFEKRAP